MSLGPLSVILRPKPLRSWPKAPDICKVLVHMVTNNIRKEQSAILKSVFFCILSALLSDRWGTFTYLPPSTAVLGASASSCLFTPGSHKPMLITVSPSSTTLTSSRECRQLFRDNGIHPNRKNIFSKYFFLCLAGSHNIRAAQY